MIMFYEEQSEGDKSECVFSPFIQRIDMNAVDIHDVTSFLQKWNTWIPISSVKALKFNTILDLPLDDDKLAAVKACGTSVDTVIFQQCENNLDMFQHLKALRTCFTSLSRFVVIKCNLSFAYIQMERRTDSKGFSWVESMIETQLNKMNIHITECKHVNISDVLLLGLYATVNSSYYREM